MPQERKTGEDDRSSFKDVENNLRGFRVRTVVWNLCPPESSAQIRIISKTVVLQSILRFPVTPNIACLPKSVPARTIFSPALHADYEADLSFRTSLRLRVPGARYTSTEYVPAKKHDPSIRKRSIIVCRMDREHNAPAFTTTKSQSVEKFSSAFFTTLLVHQKRYQVRSSDTGRIYGNALEYQYTSSGNLICLMDIYTYPGLKVLFDIMHWPLA
ncbi:uncharacterized protein ARMOST_21859 [Armillaria ostoyae]|uniref:Uncharacterized protein n=1 Tax=Armillaria ostoyae TaxID=47428 RepID=A0A284SB91_ARMOS|nr:uncharacterized protein ARMOST_21859 [Armillaria ostoyae]